MQHDKLALEIVSILPDDHHRRGDVTDLIRDMLHLGIMDKQQALRAVVKAAYSREVKAKGISSNSAVLQVAADYDVSVSYVKNVVYYHTEIKL